MNTAEYSREELLPEMLKLESQLGNLVFGLTDSKYHMVDIYNELKSKNAKAGNPAGKELKKYKKLSFAFYKEIHGG